MGEVEEFEIVTAVSRQLNSDVVVLLEFLLGEGRAEVRVALAHKTDHVLLVRFRNPIRRGPAAALIREARTAVSFKRSEEPPALALKPTCDTDCTTQVR